MNNSRWFWVWNKFVNEWQVWEQNEYGDLLQTGNEISQNQAPSDLAWFELGPEIFPPETKEN